MQYALRSIPNWFLQHVDTAQRALSPGDIPSMKGLKSQVEHKKNGRRLMNHHIQVNFRHDKSQLASNYDDLDLYLSLYSPKARWIAFGYGAGFFRKYVHNL